MKAMKAWAVTVTTYPDDPGPRIFQVVGVYVGPNTKMRAYDAAADAGVLANLPQGSHLINAQEVEVLVL